MHVADVTMFYAPQSGGVRRYIDAKRAWLNARPGFSHTLVVPAARGAAAATGTVPVPSFPLPRSNGYRVALSPVPAARALIARRPTVIEAGDPYPLAWAALKAARELGVPAVAFCHSDLPAVLGGLLGGAAEHFAARYYARLYRRFDLVLAPSRGMTARLHAWGVVQARYQPLGVDLETFRPQSGEGALRRRLGVADSARLIVYAGRFAREKNLDVLVDALAELGSGYAALLIGAGDLPRALPPNVRVLPYVAERAELASLLSACDVFVHPGDKETFGLGVLEAMACGLPVIGADAAGVAELVTPETGILVPPRDVAALTAALAALFERDLTALRLGARRRAEVFGWERILPQIIARYEALGAVGADTAGPAVGAATTAGASPAMPARSR